MNEENDFDPSNFLGLPDREVEKARAVVLPLPLEMTVSYGAGTAGGPEAIIKASHQVEFFDEETLVDFSCAPLVHTAEPPEDATEVRQYLKNAEKLVKEILHPPKTGCRRAPNSPTPADKFIVALGGEHTISHAMIRGITADFENMTVVHIDAHADLIDRLQGRRWSHGTVMRRIHELGCTIIQLGIRSLSREEYVFAAKSERVHTFYAHRMQQRWSELIGMLSALENDVYISIDVDGIDPSLIPSTGTPMPGGLNWAETMEVIRAVAESGARWMGADLVEFIPSPAPPGCDIAAARLLSKILAFRFSESTR